MNAALSDAIKEAYAIAPAGQVTYDTLEVRQDGVQDPIFLVKARSPLVAFDEHGIERTFEASGFMFSLPPSSEEGFQSLNIVIDNVGQRITDFVVLAKSQRVPIQILYRPYLSTDLTQPQMNPPLVLYLKDVQVSMMQVSGRATFMDIVNKKFPSILYTRQHFPTLG